MVRETIVNFYLNLNFCFLVPNVTFRLYNQGEKPKIFQVTPLEYTFPNYLISITPMVAISTEYYCNSNNWGENSQSNSVFVAVNQPPTSPTPTLTTQSTVFQSTATFQPTQLPSPNLILTSNSSSISLNKPINFHCNINHFKQQKTKYQVNLFNNRDGQLASYEVDGKDAKILTLFKN